MGHFWRIFIIIWITWAIAAPISPCLAADETGNNLTRLQQRLEPLVDRDDAVMIRDLEGNGQMAVHPQRGLIPASTIKILTALTAIRTLGAGYRFPTEFYLTQSGSLIIKGYGDPLHVSENIRSITIHLAQKFDRIEDIGLDDSYFTSPIIIPGTGRSLEPYDAANGALCANFNTVAFRRSNGQWISDEAQTPLLPVVMGKIKASGLDHGRITLAGTAQEGLQYTGELYRYFLEQAGVKVTGRIGRRLVDPQVDRLVYRYESAADLDEVIAALLTFSNNFIANQIVLVMGARVHGAPATMEKGLEVLRRQCRSVLKVTDVQLAEGAGISRQNRISAQSMTEILRYFYPYKTLMRHEGRQWYKTGTLNGIHTRVGFLEGANGRTYSFVVLLNTAGKTTDRIMDTIERVLR